MKSIIDYPNRGKWGNSKYRGNCSGYLFKDLIEHFNPKLFVDTCKGSGTSEEVCKEMNVEYIGLDLNSGFNFLKDSIAKNIPSLADICFSHPPYHDMVIYSGDQWGEAHQDDISRCSTYDEFLEKSQLMLMNQREATIDGGIYCTLIGDYRKKGKFYTTQADYLSLMPRNEIHSMVVKIQNNHLSSFKSYNGHFIPILHEYLIIWKKQFKQIWSTGFEIAQNSRKAINMTWRNVIRMALMNIGKEATLNQIYEEVSKLMEGNFGNNKNWQAKIRQQLQIHFTNGSRGVWAI